MRKRKGLGRWTGTANGVSKMASPYGDMEKMVQQYEAMIEKRDDALALDRQGLTTLALQGYREYITARKALFKYVGEERDAPHVPSAMHRIAVAYSHANEHLKAIDLYKQALQYYHSHLGPEHLETAAAYANLGIAFQNIGRHDHAIKMLRASLKVRDAKLGKDHLDTADVSHSLAFSLEELGEVREALALYEEAARVRRAEIPASTDTAATIHNAGGAPVQVYAYGGSEACGRLLCRGGTPLVRCIPRCDVCTPPGRNATQ